MRRFIRSERGQSMVEFALILPIFMLLLVGIVDYSRVIIADIQITNATQEVAKEFEHRANTPKYITWYDEDVDKSIEDRRINKELKGLVVKSVDVVPDENISLDAIKYTHEGLDGESVKVNIKADVPSLSGLTFKSLQIERKVTLRIREI